MGATTWLSTPGALTRQHSPGHGRPVDNTEGADTDGAGTGDPTPTRNEQDVLNRLEREAAKEVKVRARRAAKLARLTGPKREPCHGGDAGETSASRSFRQRIRRIGIITILAVIALGVLYPPFLIPVRGTTTSGFFIRNAPDSTRLFDFEHHSGLDIAAPIGTRVMASRSGRVIAVGNDPDYGTFVDVRHPLGSVTRYAHLSSATVSVRRWVWRRGSVGAVGMTGRTTGPHLHFEVRLGSRPLPPNVFLFFHALRRAITG